VDARELARFARLADSWWNANGPLRALHHLNPARLRYIRDRLCAHFGRDARAPAPLAGLCLLDIGCGGGLLAEPMARLGARVVGADAAEENILVARRHADEVGLDIDYRATTAEALAESGEVFDTVLNMEVIEHVADATAFIGACGALVAPGGAMVVATLNRTAKSFTLAIIGAEYVLGWLPRGTHRWERFVRPAELARAARGVGLALEDLTGVAYDAASGDWRPSRDVGVNYMGFFVKRRSNHAAAH
jgi:2-polyprenyl-6-hydroxyphenyl methylase/3-demethylubiquinone-9 3-methyltransferase